LQAYCIETTSLDEQNELIKECLKKPTYLDGKFNQTKVNELLTQSKVDQLISK